LWARIRFRRRCGSLRQVYGQHECPPHRVPNRHCQKRKPKKAPLAPRASVRLASVSSRKSSAAALPRGKLMRCCGGKSESTSPNEHADGAAAMTALSITLLDWPVGVRGAGRHRGRCASPVAREAKASARPGDAFRRRIPVAISKNWGALRHPAGGLAATAAAPSPLLLCRHACSSCRRCSRPGVVACGAAAALGDGHEASNEAPRADDRIQTLQVC